MAAVQAVARAEAVDEAELRAEQLCTAAETRDRAGDDEAHQHIPPDREAVEAAGGLVQANSAELEAGAGPEQEVVQEQAHDHRDHEPPRHAHPLMIRGRCTASSIAGVCGTEASRIQLV